MSSRRPTPRRLFQHGYSGRPDERRAGRSGCADRAENTGLSGVSNPRRFDVGRDRRSACSEKDAPGTAVSQTPSVPRVRTRPRAERRRPGSTGSVFGTPDIPGRSVVVESLFTERGEDSKVMTVLLQSGSEQRSGVAHLSWGGLSQRLTAVRSPSNCCFNLSRDAVPWRTTERV